MIGKQTLGWIGASVAAGLYPTFSMSFAADTLAAGLPASDDVTPADGEHRLTQDKSLAWAEAHAGLSLNEIILRPSAS